MTILTWCHHLQREPRGRFICVELARIAGNLSGAIDETSEIIGVGNSGYKFACMIRRAAIKQEVKTDLFSRERENRRLACEAIYRSGPVTLVDDLAVSGTTLQSALSTVDAVVEGVALAMLFDSKTTRRRIDQPNLQAGVIYSRIGGGRPPINSIATLATSPDRVEELSARYFTDYSREFTELVTKLGAENEAMAK